MILEEDNCDNDINKLDMTTISNQNIYTADPTMTTNVNLVDNNMVDNNLSSSSDSSSSGDDNDTRTSTITTPPLTGLSNLIDSCGSSSQEESSLDMITSNMDMTNVSNMSLEDEQVIKERFELSNQPNPNREILIHPMTTDVITVIESFDSDDNLDNEDSQVNHNSHDVPSTIVVKGTRRQRAPALLLQPVKSSPESTTTSVGTCDSGNVPIAPPRKNKLLKSSSTTTQFGGHKWINNGQRSSNSEFDPTRLSLINSLRHQQQQQQLINHQQQQLINQQVIMSQLLLKQHGGHQTRMFKSRSKSVDTSFGRSNNNNTSASPAKDNSKDDSAHSTTIKIGHGLKPFLQSMTNVLAAKVSGHGHGHKNNDVQHQHRHSYRLPKSQSQFAIYSPQLTAGHHHYHHGGHHHHLMSFVPSHLLQQQQQQLINYQQSVNQFYNQQQKTATINQRPKVKRNVFIDNNSFDTIDTSRTLKTFSPSKSINNNKIKSNPVKVRTIKTNDSLNSNSDDSGSLSGDNNDQQQQLRNRRGQYDRTSMYSGHDSDSPDYDSFTDPVVTTTNYKTAFLNSLNIEPPKSVLKKSNSNNSTTTTQSTNCNQVNYDSTCSSSEESEKTIKVNHSKSSSTSSVSDLKTNSKKNVTFSAFATIQVMDQ